MKKYIITQVPPEHAELLFYFAGDTFTEDAGGIEYALIPLIQERWSLYPVINEELWQDLTRTAENITNDFDGIREDGESRSTYSRTYKEVMQDYGINYNPTRCHRLKEWSTAGGDPSSPDSIADYLSIVTGRTWRVATARGYCQGDYAEIIYCADIYSAQDAQTAGEIALGAANEYSITELDDDGSELETVYGYIVADCQAWRDDDIKKLVCSWEGIDPAAAELRMIDGYTTRTEYQYRTA